MTRTKFDTFLTILYAPMCLIAFLMHMATEAALNFTDPVRIALGYFVGYAGPFIGFLPTPVCSGASVCGKRAVLTPQTGCASRR